MDKPANLADIDPQAMSFEEHLLDMSVVGLLVKQARGELTRGMRKALVQWIATTHKCHERTVERHIAARHRDPQYQMFIVG